MIQRNKSLEMLVENAFYMTISDEPNVVGSVGDVFFQIRIFYTLGPLFCEIKGFSLIIGMENWIRVS